MAKGKKKNKNKNYYPQPKKEKSQSMSLEDLAKVDKSQFKDASAEFIFETDYLEEIKKRIAKKEPLKPHRKYDFTGKSEEAMVIENNSTAPYNFVSLPNTILPSKLNSNIENHAVKISDAYKEYINTTEKLSGCIELNMRLLAPLFIRAEAGKTIAPVDDKHPIIPGSSIRGMVKNLFKIVTCGAMRENEDYTERNIYYRSIMAVGKLPWSKPLHALYAKKITSFNYANGKRSEIKNAKPGFLLKIKNEYFIAPSMLKNPKRVFIKDYMNEFRCTIDERNDSRIDWHNGIAYIITGSQKEADLKTSEEYKKLKDDKARLKAGKQQIRYIDINDIDKSVEHWLEVPHNVIEDYRDDVKRKGVNLLDYKKTNNSNGDYNGEGVVKGSDLHSLAPEIAQEGIESLIPCFYLENDGYVSAFGHGQCFRVPYNNSIGDAIPAELHKDTVDFADAVFGKKEAWGSRVFFEDAKVIGQPTMLNSKNVILGEPNPTSYQLYLKQQKNTPLVHWDMAKSEIRGYKMYWHQKMNDTDWNNLNVAQNDNTDVMTKIKPIASGTEFKGKIRFRNLSSEELGALMMVFDLNGRKQDCAYKLGQGKSLGLGSVDITAELKLDAQDNYEELFADNGWSEAVEDVSADKYLKAFTDYLTQEKMTDQWQRIMQELTNILSIRNLDKPNWNNKIKTMEGTTDYKGSWSPNEKFIDRIPMKTINKVVR